MLKVISFDLDGTLVKSTFADKVWLEGLPELYSREKNVPLNKAKNFIFGFYEKIGENKKEWYDIDWWFDKFKLNESWQDLLDKYRNHIKLYSETIETLEILKNKYDLIIISNAKREFIDIQLKKTNLNIYFKYVFSSLSDFNLVKKTPDVYRQLLSLLKIKSDEIIHLGDNFEFDYISPKKIGISSYYLDRKKKEKGNHVIHSLSELKNIIRNYQ
jgi:putative hydrolase of the HAD superfamily